MAFRVPVGTRESPIEIRFPEGAKPEDQAVFRFRSWTATELLDFRDQASTEGADLVRPGLELVHRLLVGWDGVLDHNGKAIEFSRENVDVLPLQVLQQLAGAVAAVLNPAPDPVVPDAGSADVLPLGDAPGGQRPN
jgi:hypothetical protein